MSKVAGKSLRHDGVSARRGLLAPLMQLVARPGVVAVIGPHGCGKTTLLRALHKHGAPDGLRLRLIDQAESWRRAELVDALASRAANEVVVFAGRSPWLDADQAASLAEQVEIVAIPQADASQLRPLLRDALGVNPEPRLVAELVAATRGDLHRARGLIEAARQRGELTRYSSAWIWSRHWHTPDDVAAEACAAVDRLSADAAAAVQAVAAMGEVAGRTLLPLIGEPALRGAAASGLVSGQIDSAEPLRLTVDTWRQPIATASARDQRTAALRADLVRRLWADGRPNPEARFWLACWEREAGSVRFPQLLLAGAGFAIHAHRFEDAEWLSDCLMGPNVGLSDCLGAAAVRSKLHRWTGNRTGDRCDHEWVQHRLYSEAAPSPGHPERQSFATAWAAYHEAEALCDHCLFDAPELALRRARLMTVQLADTEHPLADRFAEVQQAWAEPKASFPDLKSAHFPESVPPAAVRLSGRGASVAALAWVTRTIHDQPCEPDHDPALRCALRIAAGLIAYSTGNRTALQAQRLGYRRDVADPQRYHGHPVDAILAAWEHMLAAHWEAACDAWEEVAAWLARMDGLNLSPGFAAFHAAAAARSSRCAEVGLLLHAWQGGSLGLLRCARGTITVAAVTAGIVAADPNWTDWAAAGLADCDTTTDRRAGLELAHLVIVRHIGGDATVPAALVAAAWQAVDRAQAGCDGRRAQLQLAQLQAIREGDDGLAACRSLQLAELGIQLNDLTPSPLSRREREIATLAAHGMTNRKIAEQLYLSVRTVETHLSRIYTKLNLSGRAGLIALRLRRNWPEMEPDPAGSQSGSSH